MVLVLGGDPSIVSHVFGLDFDFGVMTIIKSLFVFGAAVSSGATF